MMLNSNVEPYNCPVCNQGYRTKKSLKRHLKRHADNNSYMCEICASSFASRAEITAHRRTHRDEKLYKCGECFRSFSRRDSLLRHVNVHSLLELKCDLCEKTFKNEIAFNIHHRLHVGEKPYQCDLCDSAFVCKSYLCSHRRKVHNIENVLFQCDVCHKIYKNSVGLKRHKISHSSDRPHICHMCPQTFKYKGDLRLHLRRHVCPKPYVCNVCSKAFSSWAGMNEHKRTHSSAKDFQCETCGKSYRRKSHLARHNLSHGDEKQFVCRYCDKRFRYKRGMNVHIRSHTGHRPYACDLCGRHFAQKSRMKSHRMTHTGEKPFRCIACSKAFCRHDKLTDHCRRMHKQLIVMDKSPTSPFEHESSKTGLSGGSAKSDAKNKSDANQNKPSVADAKNYVWDRNPKVSEISELAVRNTNAVAGRYNTRSRRSAVNHENGDVVMDSETGGRLNSKQRKPIVIGNGEDDSDMSLKIEVFEETELTDDFYLNESSREFLADVRDTEQLKGTTTGKNGHNVKTTWPHFLTNEMTVSKEQMEQNDDKSNKSTDGNSEVTDNDEVTEVTDNEDATANFWDEEASVAEVKDVTAPAADADSSLVIRKVERLSKEGFCFWSDNSFQDDDEDFLFAMRVFQLLKSHPPGVQKNSLKAQVEELFLDANKASLI